jgi:drug/metabolite transporter (DMT)-like permease
LVQVAPARLGWLALSTLTSYGLGDALFFTSARSLGVPAAMAIASTYPLWAVVTGMAFLGEPAPLGRIAGVVVVVLGTVAVIITGAPPAAGRADQQRRAHFIRGVALAVATSWLWALNSVGVRFGGASLPALVTSTLRLGMALALCPLIGLVTREAQAPLFVPWQRLRPVLWAFALEAIGGTLFFVYGLSRSSLALGATLSSLAPVLSLPVAWATRAEPLSAAKALAVATVSAGVVLLLV